MAITSLAAPHLLWAQESEWNGPEAIELLQRARAARALLLEEREPTSYEARVDGHIYFFLDREDGASPIPLRVDQVSLDVFWSPGVPTRQIIRALRSRELLPIQDMRFYRDRLTLTQGAYGDEIQIGEGRDVRGVPHPLSSGSTEHYDFRLGTGLVVQPGQEAARRIREVVVRPREPALPGFVGSIYLDEATASVVRMEFTFTKASYPDPRNDYVWVRLEHILWEGGVWLPRTQIIEVRRESPRWDLPLGTVVRSRLEVRDHMVSPRHWAVSGTGPPILVSPYAGSDSSRFRGGLLDGMSAEGLAGPSGPVAFGDSEIRRLASSGLPRFRPHADRLSSLLRANRGEGVRMGGGASYTHPSGARVEALAGYAMRSRQPSLGLTYRAPPSNMRPGVRVGWREFRDVGWPEAGQDALGSLGAIFSGEDRTDPYHVTGIEGRLTALRGGAAWTWHAAVERHEAMAWSWLESPILRRPTRPVRPIEPGTELSAKMVVSGTWLAREGAHLEWETGAKVGYWGRQPFAEVQGRGWFQLAEIAGSTTLEGSLSTAMRLGTTPVQSHHFLGGVSTLPGHDWRKWAGTRMALLGGSLSREIVPIWLGAEAFGAVGVAAAPGSRASAWAVAPSGSPRASAGIGLSGFRGMLRLRLARGIGGGHDALFLVFDRSIQPLF